MTPPAIDYLPDYAHYAITSCATFDCCQLMVSSRCLFRHFLFSSYWLQHYLFSYYSSFSFLFRYFFFCYWIVCLRHCYGWYAVLPFSFSFMLILARRAPPFSLRRYVISPPRHSFDIYWFSFILAGDNCGLYYFHFHAIGFRHYRILTRFRHNAALHFIFISAAVCCRLYLYCRLIHYFFALYGWLFTSRLFIWSLSLLFAMPPLHYLMITESRCLLILGFQGRDCLPLRVTPPSL